MPHKYVILYAEIQGGFVSRLGFLHFFVFMRDAGAASPAVFSSLIVVGVLGLHDLDLQQSHLFQEPYFRFV